MTKQKHRDPDWDFKPTDAQLRNVRPIRKTDPAVVEAMASAREVGVTYRPRGRPKTAEPKVRTSIYLSQSVLRKFKATGEGWQTRINDVLERAKV
jgi:uncharacterized protein (DUF4415 family)